MSAETGKAAKESISIYAVVSHIFFEKIYTARQNSLRNIFAISLITPLLAASSVILSGQHAYSQLAQQEEGQLLYENTIYGVKMLYPSTWTQQDSTAKGNGLITLSDFFSQKDADGYYADVSISIEDLSSSMSVEDYLAASIDVYTEADYEIISSSIGELTLSGIPAYTLEASFKDPEFGKQNLLEVGIVLGNRAFYVQYVVDPPIYQKYLPIAQGMISSVELSSNMDRPLTSTGTFGSEGDGDDRLEDLRASIGRTLSAEGSNTITGVGGGVAPVEGLGNIFREGR